MYKLTGTWGYAAGASGTVTIPEGAAVLSIAVHSTAGGTVAMFGGTAIPIIATAQPVVFRFMHRLNVSKKPTDNTIVFTGTDSYFVEYVKGGNY